VLDCDARLVRRWAADDADYPIPPIVLGWLRELAEFHRAAGQVVGDAIRQVVILGIATHVLERQHDKLPTVAA
jgi:hypothetical protein